MRQLIKRLFFGTALLLGTVCGASAEADLIITIADATVAEGGTGIVDVFIRSDAGDSLLGFGFDFQLTNLTGGSALAFSDPQSEAQLSDPSYVFFGNSAAANAPGTFGNVGPESTYNVLESTADFTDVTVPSTNTLLARLNLTAVSSNPALAGHTFRLDLLDTPAQGEFFNLSGDVPYTVNFGTITVTQAVPEPSSLLFTGLALAGVPCLKRRFRKAAAA